MNTTPENVPDETLLQAKVVHAQLLIKTNTLNIARQVFHIHKVRLEVRTIQSGEFKLLIQLDLEDVFYRTIFSNLWTPLTNRRYHHKTETADKHRY